VWPGRAADHSPTSSAAVMEEQSYTSTHTMSHIGPVTGSLYLFAVCVEIRMNVGQNQGMIKCHVAVVVENIPLRLSIMLK
jgi:hypothetical protein